MDSTPTPSAATPPAPDAPHHAAPDAPRPPADDPPVREMVPIDPWSHRRGEPRVLAFLWALFLFVATVVTFGVTARIGAQQHAAIREAARALLIIVAAGLVVLWPMVRLSQRPDPQPILGGLRDLVVILVPVHSVIWPQAMWWLANWPLSVVACLAAWLSAWAVLMGGVIAIAQARTPHPARSNPATPATPASADYAPDRPIRRATTWMAGIVGVLALSLIPAALSPADLPSDGAVPPTILPSWLVSPLLGVLEIARERPWTGRSGAVVPGHWLATLAVACVGVGVWVVAGWTWRRRAAALESTGADDPR